MSHKEAADLLQSLEDMHEDYVNQLKVIGTQMSRLSKALLEQNDDFGMTISDIKYSLRSVPKVSPEANSSEEENQFLRQAIEKLKADKEQHKASYHCLQKTGQSRSPGLSRFGTFSKTDLRRSTSNYNLTPVLDATEPVTKLPTTYEDALKQHLKHLDSMLATQKETSDLIASVLET